MTALSCAVYCRGALNLIDSFSSSSDPPWAFDLVVMVTFENAPILEPNSNLLAPLASSWFVTIYSKITMLPSSNLFPITPSPK